MNFDEINNTATLSTDDITTSQIKYNKRIAIVIESLVPMMQSIKEKLRTFLLNNNLMLETENIHWSYSQTGRLIIDITIYRPDNNSFNLSFWTNDDIIKMNINNKFESALFKNLFYDELEMFKVIANEYKKQYFS